MAQIAVLITISILWAGSWLALKIALQDVPPMTLAWMRFGIAVPVLAVIARAARLRLPSDRRDWFWLALAGLISFAANYLLIFWGTQYIPAGLAAVLQATIPASGLLIGKLWLPDQRVSRLGVAGILVGILGVAIFFGDQLRVASGLAAAACVALALTSLTNGVGGVLVKRFLNHVNPILLALCQQLCALPLLMGVAFVREGAPWQFQWSALSVASLLYMSLAASVLAFLLFFWLLKKWSAPRAMLYALLMPVVTLLLGWAVLGEQLTAQTLAGAAVVLLSVVFAVRN